MAKHSKRDPTHPPATGSTGEKSISMDELRRRIGTSVIPRGVREKDLIDFFRPFAAHCMALLDTNTDLVRNALARERLLLQEKAERPYFRALLCSHFIQDHLYLPLQGLAQDKDRAGDLLSFALWYDVAFGVAHAIHPLFVADALIDAGGAAVLQKSLQRAEHGFGAAPLEKARIAAERILEGDMADWAAIVKRDPTGQEAVARKVALLHTETAQRGRPTLPLRHIPDYLIAGVVLFGADLAEKFYAGLYPLSAS
jgi:hypothetical protein